MKALKRRTLVVPIPLLPKLPRVITITPPRPPTKTGRQQQHPLYQFYKSGLLSTNHTHHKLKLNRYYYPLAVHYCSQKREVKVWKVALSQEDDPEVAEINESQSTRLRFYPMSHENHCFRSLWHMQESYQPINLATKQKTIVNTASGNSGGTVLILH